VLAAQLLVGRETIWLPQRWRKLDLGGPRQHRFITGLIKWIGRLEKISKPRLQFLFGHRLSNIVFALLITATAVGAFAAPPFTGLDTLPALGGVLIALGVLLEDFAIVVAGVLVGIAGVALEFFLGKAVVNGIGKLF
jgi:hypothetical protein